MFCWGEYFRYDRRNDIVSSGLFFCNIIKYLVNMISWWLYAPWSSYMVYIPTVIHAFIYRDWYVHCLWTFTVRWCIMSNNMFWLAWYFHSPCFCFKITSLHDGHKPFLSMFWLPSHSTLQIMVLWRRSTQLMHFMYPRYIHMFDGDIPMKNPGIWPSNPSSNHFSTTICASSPISNKKNIYIYIYIIYIYIWMIV